MIHAGIVSSGLSEVCPIDAQLPDRCSQSAKLQILAAPIRNRRGSLGSTTSGVNRRGGAAILDSRVDAICARLPCTSSGNSPSQQTKNPPEKLLLRAKLLRVLLP